LKAEAKLFITLKTALSRMSEDRLNELVRKNIAMCK